VTLFQGIKRDIESERILRDWAFQEREEEQRELRVLEAEEKERKTPCNPALESHLDPDPTDHKTEREEDRARDEERWGDYDR